MWRAAEMTQAGTAQGQHRSGYLWAGAAKPAGSGSPASDSQLEATANVSPVFWFILHGHKDL